MSAFDLFDRIYVIHLPNAERRKAMDQQLSALGLERAEYVAVSPPPPGLAMSNMRRNPAAEFGANLSHIMAVVIAIRDRAEHPLFLEDDVVIDPAADGRLAAALAALPRNWDVLYLGGHPRAECRLVTPHLASVSTWSFAEAYSLRGEALEPLFEYWANRIGQPHAMFDFILGEYAARHNGFAVYPVVTHQPVNYSQIGNKVDDKRALVEKGWRNNLSTR